MLPLTIICPSPHAHPAGPCAFWSETILQVKQGLWWAGRLIRSAFQATNQRQGGSGRAIRSQRRCWREWVSRASVAVTTSEIFRSWSHCLACQQWESSDSVALLLRIKTHRWVFVESVFETSRVPTFSDVLKSARGVTVIFVKLQRVDLSLFISLVVPVGVQFGTCLACVG